MLILRSSLILLFLLALLAQQALTQPFIRDIERFRELDKLESPPPKPVLFIGSSSFTNWKDVAQWFPEHRILNRAFGGSSLTHLIRYAEDIIFRYDPIQVVIYCGENDLAEGSHISADSVFHRFVRLHSLIRKRYPAVQITYVSMKPSPSRIRYLPAMEEGNRRIERFARKKRYTNYVDVHTKMRRPDGGIMAEIFGSDSLHMNRKGYEIWAPVIKPYLIR